MKKIYWIIQQMQHIGGTEIVTINIINKISKYRDVTLIVTGTENANFPIKINENVEIIYLNVPYKYTCLEDYTGKLKAQKKYFKALNTVIGCSFFWIFKKRKYRKQVDALTTKDDIIVCSSFDNYMIAPKTRRCLFHFHFNANFFFSPMVSAGRLLHRKPDKYIFLTANTKEVIESKRKAYRNSYQVYNPTRFQMYYDNKTKNNEILFLARYAPQKNPLLAVKVAHELSKIKKDFHLSMYGNGLLKTKLDEYVKENHLEDYVTINEATSDPLEKIRNSDLLLITSDFEGSPLSIIEALSQSVPVISSNWGDAVSEVVVDGDSGYIINSKNPYDYAIKIKELLEDKEKLSNFRTRAYNFSYKFSDEIITKNWLDLFNEEDHL